MRDIEYDPSFALITGVPFLIMSMLLFWAGLFGLRSYLNIFTVITPTAYILIKIIFSLVVVLFSIISMKDGWLTEGVVFMFIGVSSLSTSISAAFELQEILELDLVYGLVIIVCSLFMFKRKAVFRAAASAFVGLALSVTCLLPAESKLAGPLFLVFSGVLYFIYFAYVTYHTEDDKSYVSERKDKYNSEGHVGDTYEIVMIVGCLAIGLLFLFDGGMMLSGVNLGDTSVVVSMAMLSIVAIAIAIYASIKGELAEAVLVLMIAICYLFSSVSLLGKFEVAPLVVEFVTSAVLIATMLCFYKRGNWMLLVISTLAFIQGVAMAFVSFDTAVIAWYSIIEGLLCVYLALSVWFVVELKEEILPVLDGY